METQPLLRHTGHVGVLRRTGSPGASSSGNVGNRGGYGKGPSVGHQGGKGKSRFFFICVRSLRWTDARVSGSTSASPTTVRFRPAGVGSRGEGSYLGSRSSLGGNPGPTHLYLSPISLRPPSMTSDAPTPPNSPGVPRDGTSRNPKCLTFSTTGRLPPTPTAVSVLFWGRGSRPHRVALVALTLATNDYPNPFYPTLKGPQKVRVSITYLLHARPPQSLSDAPRAVRPRLTPGVLACTDRSKSPRSPHHPPVAALPTSLPDAPLRDG